MAGVGGCLNGTLIFGGFAVSWSIPLSMGILTHFYAHHQVPFQDAIIVLSCLEVFYLGAPYNIEIQDLANPGPSIYPHIHQHD